MPCGNSPFLSNNPCGHYGPTLNPCGGFGATIPCGPNFSFPLPPLDVTPQIQRAQSGRGLQTLEDVQTLRKELEGTMAQLDEIEAEMSGPRTLEEAEDLEAKLEDALKELKKRKKKLENR